MIAHIKTFVLWLLIAALPLQGFAAVSASPCGAARHHAAAASEASRHQLEVHATDARHVDHHRHAAPCDKDAGKTASSSCQSCCSVAGLLPAGVNWLLPQARADQPQAAPDFRFTGHIPGGIERPPRLS